MTKCNCECENFNIEKNVKYEISNFEKPVVIKTQNGNSVLFELKQNEKVLQFEHNKNKYFLINPNENNSVFSCSFMSGRNLISISLASFLCVTVNGKIKKEFVVEGLTYSHFETLGELTLIYFVGKRDFVVVLEKEEVKEGMFFDEFNLEGRERCFMCKLNDSLNHGKVIHISNEKVENYLVYLDENDLNLKSEFVAYVFVDCLLAGNYKYCNNLLSESLKQKDENNIKKFFCEFDYIYPLEDNVFALIKKNTLAGIYKFEVNNLQIENIVISS